MTDLQWQNLVFFMRYVRENYGVEMVTNPKEAIEATQRAAYQERENRQKGIHLRALRRQMRTETPSEVLTGSDPAVGGRCLRTLAPGPQRSEETLRLAD